MSASEGEMVDGSGAVAEEESTVQHPGADPEARHYRIFVVHHTHWDREWWATYQDFRIRLVETIDELLDTLDSDPSFRTFLLDSQTIVLKDYLEIRPERRESLVRYIRSGRIQCGPWHILPDEFLVSGEAHIRNLWLGKRTASELDCPIQRVGYLPDTFGHLAQMPQILRGFGIDNALVWRGYGGADTDVRQEFLWESPDGSSVLTHWFPDGYYWMPFLHFGNPDRPYEDKLGRIYRSIEHWGPLATSDVLLMPYGGDHRPIDRGLAGKIAEANQVLGDRAEIRWGTIDEYLAAVKEQQPHLGTVRGELRTFGLNHPHVLPGVLSSRLYLKQRNFWCQTWLERYAEPLSALAWLSGLRYEASLLWKAWELLVQNHPHDSICGCSIDQVHREMIPRFDGSQQIAQIVAEKCAAHINAEIDTSRLHPDDRALVVHNPLARTRSDWATVWIGREQVSPRTHQVLDGDGNEVPFVARDVEGTRPTTDTWFHTEIGFLAKDVPGLGHRAYQLTAREVPLDPKLRQFTAIQPTASLKGSRQVTDLAIGDNILENSRLRVEVSTRDGTLTVTHKLSGQIYSSLNAFEDGGDAGDEYNYSAPLTDTVLRSSEHARVHLSVAEAGYSRATLRIDIDWALPVALTEDRLSRSSTEAPTRISTFVTLMANSPRIDITTEWENLSRDHRLRALFPLGARSRVSQAQGQFEVSCRPVDVTEPGRGWPEPYVPTMPQQGWVAVDDGRRGLLIANRGLPEHEILRDDTGTVALTLLRAVGWLSRDDLLARVGGAGPTIPTPDAQSPGPNRVQYSIVPYTGSWLASGAFRVAEEYVAPLLGSATGSHPGDLPWDEGTIEMEGDHTLLLSACKKAEHTDALILRFWNASPDATSSRISLRERPGRVCRVDLKEDPLDAPDLAIDPNGSFTLSAGGAEIVTLAVWSNR